MAKRMKHEKHGYTHAYTPEQEAELRKNGWLPEDEVKPVSVNADVIPIKRKGGRPRKVA